MMLNDIKQMDKKDFLEDLVEYMSSIGKPIGKSPVMGYKELDLHQLFCEVIAFGGFHEVVKKVGTWAKIWKRLDNFDASVTDASYRLKKNYERCLLDYEYKCFPDHKQKSIAAGISVNPSSSYSPRATYKREHTSSPNSFYYHAAVSRLLQNANLGLSSPSQQSPPQQQQQQQQSSLTSSSESSVPTTAALLTAINNHNYHNSSSNLYSQSLTSSPAASPKLPHFHNSTGSLDTLANGTLSSSALKQSSGALSFALVERDAQGQVVLPLDVNREFVVESLGAIVPRSPFVTNKYIWPVGYRSSKQYVSMLNPSIQVKYTSQIIDAGGKPLFVVTASDEPSNPIVAQSPSQAWRIVMKRTLGKGGNSTSEHQRGKANINGTQHFGLSHPLVRELIRQLPLADKAHHVQTAIARVARNKKRKVFSSDEEEEVSVEELSDEQPMKKILRNSSGSFSSLSSDSSIDNLYQLSETEVEDLEAAVQTLCSLKYSPVTVN